MIPHFHNNINLSFVRHITSQARQQQQNMHYSTLLLGALPALCAAHAHAGVPKIVGGGNAFAALKNRNIFEAMEQVAEAAEAGASIHKKRDDICGAGVGKCPAGQCCSPAG